MKKLLLLTAFLLLAAVVWWTTGGDEPAPAPAAAPADYAPQAAPPSSPLDSPGARAGEVAEEGPARTRAANQRPVSHPAHTPCDYDLAVSRLDDPDDPLGVPSRPGPAPDFDPQAVCRLHGRVVAPRGSAVVSMAAGLDAGRRIELDEDGWFELVDLHPGRAVVRIEGSGGMVAERLVELAADGSTPEELLVDFTRLGTAALRLVDHQGKPLAEVDVKLDGRVARTDAQGVARVAGLPLGEAWCEIRHGDHARRGESVPVLAQGAEGEPALVALLPGSRLEIQLDAEVEPRDLLQVAVVPALGRNMPEPALLGVPWWTWEPLAIPAGEKAWIAQLPPGRYTVVVFVNGAVQRSKRTLVDLPPGRMRNVHISLGRPECKLVRTGTCAGAATIHWRTANRYQKNADDYDLDGQAAARLGLPASPGVRGTLQGDAKGVFCVPRGLYERGAQWSWSTCGAGYASAAQLFGPSMDDYRDPVEALPGPVVVELPEVCAGRELRLRVDGAPRAPATVDADARVDLGELHGLWRLVLSGKELERPLILHVAANGATAVSFRRPAQTR